MSGCRSGLASERSRHHAVMVPFCLADNIPRWIQGLRGVVLLGVLLAAHDLVIPTARATVDSPLYRIRVWNAEQGLPQNSVTSILHTRDGYLWLGTFNGMARFDGVQFKVLEPGNTPGLPSNRILSLFEDGRGALWIGTEEGELARNVDGQVQVFSPARAAGRVPSVA